MQQITYPLIVSTKSDKEVLIYGLAVHRSTSEERSCRIVRQPFIKCSEQHGLDKFLLYFFNIREHIAYRHILHRSRYKVNYVRTAACFLVYQQLFFCRRVGKRGDMLHQPECFHSRKVAERYRQNITLVASVTRIREPQPAGYQYPALPKVHREHFKKMPDQLVPYHMRLFCCIEHVLEIVKDDEVARGVQCLR